MRVLAIGLMVAGCTVNLSPPPPVAPRDVCDAGPAQALVGAPAERASEAQRLSGAGILRLVRPGEAVTMDFRPDRVTVEIDAKETIAAVRCG